jgi:diguanylate cyclase (GGDEF)-like protein/PAS domain S-box-containing protein
MTVHPSSLRWHVPLVLAVLWLLAIALSMGNTLSFRHADLSRQLERDARAQLAQLVRLTMGASLADARVIQEFAHAATAHELRALAVVSPEGRVLHGQHRAWVGLPAAATLDGWDPALAERALRGDEAQLAWSGNGRLALAQRVELAGDDASLRGGAPALVWMTLDPRPLREALTAKVLRARLPDMAVTALLVALLGLWLHRRVVQPLGALTQAADAVRAGRPLARVAPSGAAEVQRLGEAFDAMLRALAEANAERAASEQRLRLALEASGDGGWVWDLVSDRVEYSDGFARLLRHPGPGFRDAFVLRERLHPDDREATLAAVQRSIDDGVPFAASYRLRCFDGEYRWFLGRAGVQRDAQGRAVRFSGVLSDLQGRLQAEERLRLAQAVFEHTREGVLITDAQQRIVAVNPAFARALGQAPDELVGRTPHLIVADGHDASVFETIWHDVARVGHGQGEIVTRTRDGRRLPQLVSISAVRDAGAKVTHFVGVFSDITQLKQTEERLDFLAHHDVLTQLPNRLLLNIRLDQALAAAERHGTQVALLLLDLDHFKDVNDSWGHAAGDRLLQHVAVCLRQRLRRSDTLARLGGDEFALVMNDVAEPDAAARLAASLQAVLAQPWRGIDGEEIAVACSIGIAMSPAHGADASTLMAHADAALYRAKGDGRGVVRFYSDALTAAVRDKLRTEARLKRALAEERFELHWQPQIDVASGRVVGAEALLRWRDPDEGLILPGRFIGVAEASGLIDEIGAWALRAACRQARRWADAGWPPITLAVNVSARQLQCGDFAARVVAELEAGGVLPSCLELEITESVLMAGDATAQALARLDMAGVRLAIDDFGTGYSSLAQLKRFPVHRLKIDRSFVTGLPDDGDDVEIASSVIAMGHALGLQVLAEGVETEAQLAFLRERGCDVFQGFLAAPALAATDFEAFWRSRLAPRRLADVALA